MIVYEHQRLYVGEQDFNQKHLDALLKLNEYHNWKYFQPISKGIQFNQYVGIIQIDGLSIEIHPKADKNDADGKWQKVLLQLLKSCGKLKAKSVGTANVKRTNLNLLEVYFDLYLSELDKLIRKGFIKQYRKETSNTKALKGKLEFAGNIQKNLVHKERFYTTHQVYDTNHLLHQVLYNALEIVGQFTKGTQLYERCKRLELNFEKISKKNITKQQVNSIQLNRKSASYSYGLELARLIILNYSPDISDGKEKMVSLLFDMNVLWEEYVLKQLQKYCEGKNIEVFGQESKSFWGSNSLKPDIILKKDGKTYIIDTKWKCPNGSASVSDLRQMYSYCRFWNAEKALLLYPGENKNNSFKSFETDDYSIYENETYRINHQCKMGFVSVVDENGDLNKNIGLDILKIIGIE